MQCLRSDKFVLYVSKYAVHLLFSFNDGGIRNLLFNVLVSQISVFWKSILWKYVGPRWFIQTGTVYVYKILGTPSALAHVCN